jgi:hypothetical protein
MLDITASQFMIMYVDLNTDVETKVLRVDNAGRDQQTNSRTSTPPVPVLASSLNHLYRPCLPPFPQPQS